MLDSGSHVMWKRLHKIYLRRDSNVSFQCFAFRESFENTKPSSDPWTAVRPDRVRVRASLELRYTVIKNGRHNMGLSKGSPPINLNLLHKQSVLLFSLFPFTSQSV